MDSFVAFCQTFSDPYWVVFGVFIFGALLGFALSTIYDAVDEIRSLLVCRKAKKRLRKHYLKVCSHCGSYVGAGDKFCCECGTAF